VIRYFYQKALQEEDDPDINDYRYPGPKPQTKETAVLMLADGVEATVRSHEQSGRLITERDRAHADGELPRGAHTIAEIVQQIIEARLASGQLDECPLTLRDIQDIRSSFVKTLQGIYHPRVEYPKFTKEAQSQP
jgi:membrane-associated HD superfamily phosphohydrolase